MRAFLNDTPIDFDPATVPGFKYSVWSITDPDKVQGSSTTTFTIPATDTVRGILGSPDTAAQVDRFHTLTFANESVVVWSARVVVASYGRDQYEVFAVGDNGGWARAAKDTKLQDLALGESDLVTAANMEASWTDTDALVVWPLLDYGAFQDRAASYDVDPAFLRPAVRVWRILGEFFMRQGLSVRAAGRFVSLWKKLILPHTSGNIQVSERFLTDNITTAEEAGTQAITVTSGEFTEVIEVTTATSDPGGNHNGTDGYTAPYDQTMKVRLRGSFSAVFVGTAFNRGIFMEAYNATTGQVRATVRIPLPSTATPTVDLDVESYTFNVSAGDVIKVRLKYLAGIASLYATSASLSDAVVTWTPTNIEYQKDIAFDIASTLADVSVADVIKAITTTQNIVVTTDQATNTVTFRYIDDYLRDTSVGVSWAGRINSLEAPQRLQDAIPSAVEFTWADDPDDEVAETFRADNGRGYGDGFVTISNGYAEPYTASLKFAATHDSSPEAFSLGGMPMPVLYKRNRTYQTANYKWKPRILVFDGVQQYSWVLDGSTMSYAPVCYFVHPSERYGHTLSFTTEPTRGAGALGTFGTYWRRRLSWMADGDVVEVRAMVPDHEAGTFDFGAPVEVDYGYGSRWYYVEGIDDKQFGVHEYCTVRLIPMSDG